MNDSRSMTSPILSDEFKSDWERMNRGKRERGLLEDFNDRKLGMFIHWGLYSIPAGVWNGQPLPGICEWAMWFAQIPRDDYAELGKQFSPAKFDAAEWVKLAKDAGMTYIVVTSKHHDGFALWDSVHSDFTITQATPSSLQPLDELFEECQKQGLGFGLYYSHVIDWHDGWEGEGGSIPNSMLTGDSLKDNPMNTWDPPNVSRRHYFDTKAYPQLDELLDRYPNLYCIWFDYWYEGKYLNPNEAYAFYKMVHDKQPDCLVNSRIDGYEKAGKTLGDYISAGDNALLEPGDAAYWETPGTLNNTWGYSTLDNDWKSETELIYWIVSIISRGGNYLLNIGPRADGSIPDGTYTGFDHIGRWLAVNGDAVYGASAWTVDKEGGTADEFEGTTDRKKKGFQANFTAEDIWFTCKGSEIFAIGLSWPEANKVLVKSVSHETIQSVQLLCTDAPVVWEMTPNGLIAALPSVEFDTIGFALRITTT